MVYRRVVLVLLLVLSILVGGMWIVRSTVTDTSISEIVSSAGDYNATHYIFHLKVEYPAGSGNIYEAYAIVPKNLSYLEPFTLYLNWSFTGSSMASYWVFIDGGTYVEGTVVGEKHIRYDGWWELHPGSPWNVALYIKFNDKFNGPMAYTPSLPVQFTVPSYPLSRSEVKSTKLILRVYDPDTSDICRIYVNGTKVFETQLTIYYRHHVVDWWNRYVDKADLDRVWLFVGEKYNISIRIYNETEEVYHRDIIYTVEPEGNIVLKVSYGKPISGYPRLNIAAYTSGIVYYGYEVTFLSPSYITVLPRNTDPYENYRKRTPFTMNVTKGGFWDNGWIGSYGVQLMIIDRTDPFPNPIKIRIDRVFGIDGRAVTINRTYILHYGDIYSNETTATASPTPSPSPQYPRYNKTTRMIFINNTWLYIEAVPIGSRGGRIEFNINITRPRNIIVFLEIISRGEVEIPGYGIYNGNATIILGSNTDNTLHYDTPILVLRGLAEPENVTDTLTVLSTVQNITLNIKKIIVNGTQIPVNETITVIGQHIRPDIIQSLYNIYNKYGLLLVAVPIIFILLLLLALAAGRRRR